MDIISFQTYVILFLFIKTTIIPLKLYAIDAGHESNALLVT